MARGRKLLPGEVEGIRLDYTDPGRTVTETAKRAGVAPSTVRALAKRRGWNRRRDFGSGADGGSDRVDAGQALAAPLATLERATSRSALALERLLAAGDAPDPERAARALATLARTVAYLRKLQAEREQESQSHDEPPPRTLSELRDELRRHLERISEEDEAEGDPAFPEGPQPG